MHVFHGEKGTRALLSARQQGGRAGRRPAVLLLILLLLSTVPVLLSSEKTRSSPGNEPQGLQGRQRPRKRVLGQQGPRARVCARYGRWVWKGVTVSQRGSHTLLLLKVPAAIPPLHHCRCHIPAMSGFSMPHKTLLADGIRVGTVMRIRGVVPDQAGRFYVNLLCGEEPGSEAALHFNPRLDESSVVFNSLEHGAWGREERGPGIPFQRGQPFDVLLITTDEGFKVVVGDLEYHHFRHRMPPTRVRAVEVGGDLQLELVKIF
uniref:Galectin n=3 Tax=Sus scrofa TaxID=9823 RepID=A0A8D0PU80_PIG